ncbi:putative C2H2 finger domain protein [Talaromyces proteolyticus]|uniref:C2H2 finger domain protein n=1 Tax=Talaromyces proteolyticus TaxID=1131652 RepID=A0AAD4Q369_9EURO|nr:putative C2H2 finger domain protein [Talaromyces proteolyticus]KAH8701121.1 putative C2H2 finger domain protein [Talaromyces proteolyticus]
MARSNSSSRDRLSLPQSAFKTEAIEDPYLSGPSDLDEFSFDQHTSDGSLHQGPASRFSPVSPPTVERIPNQSMQNYEYGDNSFDPSNLFDYDLSGASDPGILSSVTTSPGDGLFGIYPLHPQSTEGHQLSSLQSLAEATLSSAFPSMDNQHQDFVATDSTNSHQPPRLNISSSTDNMDKLSVNPTPTSVKSQSPMVKVSTYSRGDSPTRDENQWESRRGSRSSIHLSPSLESNEEHATYNDDNNQSHSSHGLNASRAEDGSWHRNPATGQAGLDPSVRGNDFVPSPKDMEEERQRAERNVDIEIWSASVSAANSDAGDDYGFSYQHSRGRPRSVSAIETRHDYFSIMQPDNSNIPGPGQLIHESDPGSDFETGSDDSQPGSSKGLPSLESYLEDEPLARQFIRRYPWKDYAQFPLPVATKSQPDSSRAAMQLYDDLAKEFETASRVATWGTKRLNDTEVNNLLESDGFLKNLSISSKSTLLKLLPKRSISTSKHKRRHSQAGSRQSSFEAEPQEQDSKKDSMAGSRLSRRSSLNRPKSPTGVMAAAFYAGQMAASIGGHGSLSTTPTVSGKGNLSPATIMDRFRMRSRSEGSHAAPNLQELNIPKPRPSVAQVPSPVAKLNTPVDGDEADEDDDDSMDDKGLHMDLTPSQEKVIPTPEGFKRQISTLNPRLEPALVERFAAEQLLRYRKLIENKKRHVAAVKKGNCSARHRCFASGGGAEILPPRENAKDPNATRCQFQIPGYEASDEESNTFIDGVITPAGFPTGIPLPPVKKLPAEFECTLCFKVKKFQKPSDWTKHVHEDILPFTCTFPNCGEPKSFKRKADWVRHETERHRQLEWWACNMADCDHKCYRKDNFVQHLVREHKRPEPKTKKAKSPAVGAVESDPEIARLWKQVDECHKETRKSPEDEPCRFCGNICNDWKKLTVHLARHMEQIALPVLALVEEKSSTTKSHAKKVRTPSVASISPSAGADASNVLSSDVSNAEASINSPMMAGQASFDASQKTQQSRLHLNQSHMLLSPSDASAGTTYPPPSQYPVTSPAYLNPHYIPVHRNSMSYPPPANVMPARQPSFIPATNGPGPYQLSIPTTTINESQQLYYSPTAENMHISQEGMFPTIYGNPPAMGYQISTSPEGDNLSAPAYMTQDHSPTYPFQ